MSKTTDSKQKVSVVFLRNTTDKVSSYKEVTNILKLIARDRPDATIYAGMVEKPGKNNVTEKTYYFSEGVNYTVGTSLNSVKSPNDALSILASAKNDKSLLSFGETSSATSLTMKNVEAIVRKVIELRAALLRDPRKTERQSLEEAEAELREDLRVKSGQNKKFSPATLVELLMKEKKMSKTLAGHQDSVLERSRILEGVKKGIYSTQLADLDYDPVDARKDAQNYHVIRRMKKRENGETYNQYSFHSSEGAPKYKSDDGKNEINMRYDSNGGYYIDPREPSDPKPKADKEGSLIKATAASVSKARVKTEEEIRELAEARSYLSTILAPGLFAKASDAQALDSYRLYKARK